MPIRRLASHSCAHGAAQGFYNAIRPAHQLANCGLSWRFCSRTNSSGRWLSRLTLETACCANHVELFCHKMPGFIWYHPLRVASPANGIHAMQLTASEEIQYAKDSYDLDLQPGRLSLFLQCPGTGLLWTRLSPWPLRCLCAQRCADPLGRDA